VEKISLSLGGERIYEGESVNRSEMDMKCKTCDIFTWKKTFIS
jgi:hypothetical protein